MFLDSFMHRTLSLLVAMCLAAVNPGDTFAADDLFLYTYFEDRQENEWFTVRTYYYDSPVDHSSTAIGCNFGPEIEDYVFDADGDGNSDIVCNRIYGGDGVEELLVICKRRTVIYHGYVDSSKLDLPGLNKYGSGALRTQYDPVLQNIAITYAMGEDPIGWRTIYTDFSVLTYQKEYDL